MARLVHDIRAEIVRRLARYETPMDVVRYVKSEFDVDVSVQHVVYHDPTKPSGKKLSEKWRAIFEVTRNNYLTDVSAVPIANQGYRLAQMQEMYLEAKKAKNRGQALQIMEQAAKELGGVYSNVRTLNTPDMAKDNEVPQIERSQKLAAIIDGAFGRELKNVTPALSGK